MFCWVEVLVRSWQASCGFAVVVSAIFIAGCLRVPQGMQTPAFPFQALILSSLLDSCYLNFHEFSKLSMNNSGFYRVIPYWLREHYAILMLRPVLFGTAGDVWIFWLEAASESQCRYGGQYLLIPTWKWFVRNQIQVKKNTHKKKKKHLYERAWETFRINRHPKEQQDRGKSNSLRRKSQQWNIIKDRWISMNIDEYQQTTSNIIRL